MTAHCVVDHIGRRFLVKHFPVILKLKINFRGVTHPYKTPNSSRYVLVQCRPTT